jgi:hypothetical protein
MGRASLHGEGIVGDFSNPSEIATRQFNPPQPTPQDEFDDADFRDGANNTADE